MNETMNNLIAQYSVVPVVVLEDEKDALDKKKKIEVPIDNFDIAQNVRFSTYAVPMIIEC